MKNIQILEENNQILTICKIFNFANVIHEYMNSPTVFHSKTKTSKTHRKNLSKLLLIHPHTKPNTQNSIPNNTHLH